MLPDMTQYVDDHIRETFGTLGHLGVMAIAFGLVIALFLLKEGRLGTSGRQGAYIQGTPPSAIDVSQVPRADVGIRMALDQANGELGTESARLATSQASLTAPPATSSSALTVPEIDMTGPWYCSYDTGPHSATLSIANSKIRFDLTGETGQKESTIFDGDCLYSWQGNTGTKQCGLAQYLGLLTAYGENGDVDLAQMLLASMQEGEMSEEMQALVASCKKVDVSQSAFTPPAQVTFVEKQLDIAPDLGSFLE